MIRLKSRHQPGPNGFLFTERRTGWQSWIVDPQTQWNFTLLCQRYREHALANPTLALSTDMTTIENMMDLANALRYLQIPRADIYVIRTGAGPDPKAQAPQSVGQAVVGVVAGGKVNIEWIASAEEAVPPALSEKRAKTCVDREGKPCPQHGKGDWTRYFTEPAQRAIQMAYELRHQMKLSTPYDDKLQICDACSCPLKLKVHMPLERAKSVLTPAQIARLDPLCWLTNE